MRIKAVFFDLDDTLHDHQKPFYDAFQSAFGSHAETQDIGSVYKKFRESSDSLWEHYVKKEMTLRDLREKRIIIALKSFNINITSNEAREFQTIYETALTHLKLFPEVPELLRTLRNEGVTLGIITNGPTEHQFNKISLLGLTDYISRNLILISDDIGTAKPNPEIFHHAAKRVNYSPQELLYIGDSWQNDVVGPSKAGWNTVWFNYRKRKPDTEDQPLAEIDQLLSVLKILKKECRQSSFNS